MSAKSGSQRRKGRQVFLYLNSEQYTRLQMAASEHETTPGTFAKEKVLDALEAVQAYHEAATWPVGERTFLDDVVTKVLSTEQTDSEVAEFGDALQADHLARLIGPAPLPIRPSDGEPPAEGFRCTFTDGGYRCALETGHGGIHISPQGYRLAAVRSR